MRDQGQQEPAHAEEPDTEPRKPQRSSSVGEDEPRTLREAAPGISAMDDATNPEAAEDAGHTVDLVSGPTRPEAPPSTEALPFPHWTRYQILQHLGSGGMGTVYKAKDLRLNRLVAIKFLRYGQLDANDTRQRRRFEREAQAQARIEHPHICKIFEVGEVEGSPYLAMQLIDGVPFSEAHSSMSRDEKLRVLLSITEALHAAHVEGVIHRDIKPANIMLERRANGVLWPYLMDFGLARDVDAQGNSTTAGIEGTPAFMAPEQARGETRLLDRRTDVYSLGATMYAVFAKRPPFIGNATEVLFDVLHSDPPLLRYLDPSLPRDLETIIHKCLEKDPQRRYDSAEEVTRELRRVLDGARIAAKPPGLALRMLRYAQKHKLLVATCGMALAACLAVGAVLLRARWQAARQARLAQELGQVIKEFELFMRAAYGLPTHDIRREQAVVRERMAALRQQLAEGRTSSLGALRYALGRGHLVLREFAVAQAELEQAWQAGYRSPETRLALGLALGERYRQELEQVRRASDRDWIREQEQALEKRFLQPALSYLDGSQGRLEVPASVEGLIALYRKQYDLALRKAVDAQRQAPWLAEPIKLEGDVYQEQAIALRDRGDYKPAVEKLRQAIARHQAAAQIHRSDASIHEAEAEDWLWWLTTKEQTGDPIADTAERATAACQRAMQADPLLASVYQTQSAVYWRSAILAMMQNQSPIELVKKSIAASQQALQLDPNNWLSHYGIGSASGLLIQQQVRDSALDPSTVQTATQALQAAVRLNPNAHWAWNDLGMIFMFRMIDGLQRGTFDKELFDSFVRAEEQSLILRPDIATPLANLSYGSGLVAEYHVSIGQSAERFVAQAVKYAQRGQALNAGDRDHLNNETTGHLVAASARILRSEDPTAELDLAQRLVDKSLSLNANYGETHQQAAAIQVLRAAWALRSGKTALAAEIAATGLSVVDRGAQVSKEDAVLLGHRARLLSTLGRATLREESLRAAREAAQQMVKRTPQAVEAQETLAEVTRYLVESLIARPAGSPRTRADIGSWIAEGVAACEQALKQNPHRASVLAQRGALRLLQAQRAQATSERTEAITQARSDLQHALERNPLLAGEYAPLLTRAQTL